MMWFPLDRKEKATDLIAKLFDSVPPLVKIISEDDTPKNRARFSLAFSNRFFRYFPIPMAT